MSGGKPIEVVVRFVQRGEGVPEGGKTGELSQRKGSLDPRMLVPCANPACKKGGFLLRKPIEEAGARGEAALELEVACMGYVGALRTEVGEPPARCGNRLAASVALSYKPAPKA